MKERESLVVLYFLSCACQTIISFLDFYHCIADGSMCNRRWSFYECKFLLIKIKNHKFGRN